MSTALIPWKAISLVSIFPPSLRKNDSMTRSALSEMPVAMTPSPLSLVFSPGTSMERLVTFPEDGYGKEDFSLPEKSIREDSNRPPSRTAAPEKKDADMKATKRSILECTENNARTREFRKKRRIITAKTEMVMAGSMFVFLKTEAIFLPDSPKIISQNRHGGKIHSAGRDMIKNRNPTDIGFLIMISRTITSMPSSDTPRYTSRGPWQRLRVCPP